MAAPCEIVTDNTARLEEWIYGFGGRFAFILLGSNVKRFYPDAGATLGTVYSPRRRAVASTVSVMVLEEATHPVWSQPEGVFPDNRPDRFYPVGLTMDGEIRRLLPNHYLDFSTWQSVRQYPPPDVVLEEIQPGDVRNAVAQMVQCIRFQIRAVASNASRIYMPLTAGMDSRMLLACAQEVRERIEFITFDYLASGRQRKWLVDLDIAKRLAKLFCLSHRVVPVPVVPPSGEALKYLQRIGFSGGAGKARDFYLANCRHLDMDAAWLSGFGVEVCRVNLYWPKDDKPLHVLSLQELHRKMRVPAGDDMIGAINQLRDGVPTGSVSQFLSLFYLENRLGCWASPHLYGAAPFRINILPLCHRTVLDLMVRLPSEYKRQGRLPQDLIALAWPELSCLPYNDYPPMKRLVEQAKTRAYSWLHSASIGRTR